jgi:DNA-directed RNA polymerase specialized sigma24 family protein
MAAIIPDIFVTPHGVMPPTYRTERDTLDERFLRCHKALHFIARRILADSEMAACAVENCWLKASRNPPGFESEGAFGSWVLRLLINEALSILHHRSRSV